MLDITEVYAPRTALKLYDTVTMPRVPPIQRPDTYGARWPHMRITLAERKRIQESDPLQMCYEHDVAYNSHSPPMTLTLETALATGMREERPVQVWTARRQDSTDLLVVRIYDPLYYDITWRDRFAHIERAVAIEDECYSRLKAHGGKLVPHYFGVFVAEIPGPERPRHVYAVLLRHLEGKDVREIMEDETGERTCAEHQTSIIDAAARVLYQFFQVGVYPTDLKDSNTIIQLPKTPSNEDFCSCSTCPFRNLIQIDFHFDPDSPQPPAHEYAPRVFIIDLERAMFYSKDSVVVREADIQRCRVITAQEWSRNDYLRWVRVVDIYTVLEPYGTLSSLEAIMIRCHWPSHSNVPRFAYVRNCFPHHGNYESLPQTWSEGAPLHACEIGQRVAQTGDVRSVLGILAPRDEGVLWWTPLVIDTTDPLAERLHNTADVDRECPGLITATEEWFRCTDSDGKGENALEFDGEVKGTNFAMEIVRTAHEAWQNLVTANPRDAFVD
ncbi:hypothetical protein GGX14DRAFT_699438, partial [Mycena pura]